MSGNTVFDRPPQAGKSRGLFLDRDGTINADLGYLSDPDRLRLIPGAAEAIKMASERSFRVIVVSNQSGIARGLFTKDQSDAVNERLLALLGAQSAEPDGIYICPHHPDFGREEGADCQCRKPAPGLLLRAAAEHRIDLGKSFMVGDRLSDILAGQAAGCRSVAVGTGNPIGVRERLSADYVAADLGEAVKWVIERSDSSN